VTLQHTCKVLCFLVVFGANLHDERMVRIIGHQVAIPAKDTVAIKD
jgi:hypothetical protein